MVLEQRPKKPDKRKYSDKNQSERFVAAAQELGIQNETHAFEAAFRKIVPPLSPSGMKDRAAAPKK